LDVVSAASLCVCRLATLCGFGQDESHESAAVPEEIRLTCTQFVRYHKDQCVQDIVHQRGWVCVYSHILYVVRSEI